MEFIKAFEEIDTDDSGEISRLELENYMRAKNYKPAFVEKWLRIFDVDHSGTISLEEFCNTLGLVPGKKQQEVIQRRNTLKQLELLEKEKDRLRELAAAAIRIDSVGDYNDDDDDGIQVIDVGKESRSDTDITFNKTDDGNDKNKDEKNKNHDGNDKNKDEKNKNHDGNDRNRNSGENDKRWDGSDRERDERNRNSNDKDKRQNGNNNNVDDIYKLKNENGASKDKENDSKNLQRDSGLNKPSYQGDKDRDDRKNHNDDEDRNKIITAPDNKNVKLDSKFEENLERDNKNKIDKDKMLGRKDNNDDNKIKIENKSDPKSFTNSGNQDGGVNKIDSNLSGGDKVRRSDSGSKMTSTHISMNNYILSKKISGELEDVEIIAEDPDISNYLRQFVLKLALDSVKRHNDGLEMAKNIKAILDTNFNRNWHIVAGREAYGCLVTHEVGKFIHVRAQDWGILMWQVLPD